MSQLFPSDGQSIGVSASRSVLPTNTQDWSPLGCTGWLFTPPLNKLLLCVLSHMYCTSNKLCAYFRIVVSSKTRTTPSHLSRLSQSIGFELHASYSKFLLAGSFTYGNIYVALLVSQLGGRRDVREEGDTYIPVADSCCCMAETNTIL